MTSLRLAVLTAAVSSTLMATSWGQSYRYEFETREYTAAPSVELPEEIELSPIGSFERTEIEFAGQAPAYGDHPWGETELPRRCGDLRGPLVFFYKVHDIDAMKQRVAEADVVDETATFPMRRSEYVPPDDYWSCFGCRTIVAATPPPREATAGLTVKTVEPSPRRSRYDDQPAVASSEAGEGFIEVNYADSELLGVVP